MKKTGCLFYGDHVIVGRDVYSSHCEIMNKCQFIGMSNICWSIINTRYKKKSFKM